MSDSVDHLDAFAPSSQVSAANAELILRRHFERDLTCGEWGSEADSEQELDRRLAASKFFRIERQVDGRPYGPTPTDDVKGYRIDRVLVPLQAAKQAGWSIGPVGIECKRSNIKIGKPIAQALDYRRAFWHTEATPEVWFTLGFVFVWPIQPQFGPIASVMAQNRVGSAWPTDDGGVLFSLAGHAVANISPYGDHKFNSHADRIGRKVGSR